MMALEEDKKKHLEFIQNIITRMNTNSFQIKGMTITIVTALFAIYAASPNILFICISIIPSIIFWFLDAYYLQQERKFRGVYKCVAGISNDFEIKPFDMPINLFKNKEYSFWYVFWSPTIAWLYLSILYITIGLCIVITPML